MFSKVSIATIAMIGLVSAGPALASSKNQDSNSTAPKEQSETKAKPRYCVKSEPVTGSILQGRICKTADQWREEGIDVSRLQVRG